MIRIKENQSLRNVAENSLTAVTLLNDSVFFGINGAGKSTVCEVLSRAATLENDQSAEEQPLKVFAFDEKWRKDKVGEFVEGGSAPGVTTVNLNDGAAELEEQIKVAREACVTAEVTWKNNKQSLKTAEYDRDEIVDKVFRGERKALEPKCSSLAGTKFNRKSIRSMLEKGNYEVMSSTELDEQLRIANSQAPGMIPQLSTLPELWSFSDALWDEVTSTNPATQSVSIVVNDWVREGLKIHKPGDTCQFCEGLVKAERIDALKSAIKHAEEQASSFVKEELEKCQRASSSLSALKNTLEDANFDASIYSLGLRAKSNEVIIAVDQVLGALKESEQLLESRLKDPYLPIEAAHPKINNTELEGKYDSLKKAHAEAVQKVEYHSANQKQAIQQLKEHCCAKDGTEWKAAEEKVRNAQDAVNQADETLREMQNRLNELQKKVSTTADTAQFLDTNLALILGEHSLRVEEGSVGEGYRITRFDQRAEAMSEGEKKLVSLLYFCAEFLTEERKNSMTNTVVFFDDLGSELDEARLLVIDRFISTHFSNPKPAAIVYFTHSHTYLKILQSRLGQRALAPKDDKGDSPKSIFYEVYKDNFSGERQTTRCRKWDDKAVLLTNDYWLSFYMVLQAFESLLEGDAPAWCTGNFCRKVLEGFLEFRAPADKNFGAGLDTILAKTKINLSPALSKIVNSLSHTNLGQSGGVLTRNEVEQAVVQTLQLLHAVDPNHFNGLLIKFRGKKMQKALETKLLERTQSKSVGN